MSDSLNKAPINLAKCQTNNKQTNNDDNCKREKIPGSESPLDLLDLSAEAVTLKASPDYREAGHVGEAG